MQMYCTNPKARPRHESIDVRLYQQQETKSYLDFYDVPRSTFNSQQSCSPCSESFLTGWCLVLSGPVFRQQCSRGDQEASEDNLCEEELDCQGLLTLELYATDCQECDLKIQQDDRGVEGVIVLNDSSSRKVKMGTRMSSSSIKRSEFEDVGTRDAAQKRDAEKLQV